MYKGTFQDWREAQCFKVLAALTENWSSMPSAMLMGSWPLETPAPGDSTPSYGLHRHLNTHANTHKRAHTQNKS